MKIKKILLVGGSGIIGNQLIKKINNNYKVFVIDKQILKSKKKNLNYKKINLSKLKKYKDIIQKVDVIIYLIGIKGGQQSIDLNNLEKYIKYNFEIMVNFLSNYNSNKVKKIISASTEHVYGDNDISNKDCTRKEPSPKNYYGFSKLLSEKYLFDFLKKRFVNVDILRFPRVVSIKEDGIISQFIKKINLGKKIKFNKNKTKFNFIFIDDLIDAILLSINQINSNFRILNIFNDSKAVSLSSIAKTIESKIGKKAKISFIEKDSIDHNPYLLNISNKLAKKSLGWKPKVSFEKIVDKLINFYELKK
jgi:nucleoside-diphosphate-sugar epimerase